jgi:hypothetical protein
MCKYAVIITTISTNRWMMLRRLEGLMSSEKALRHMMRMTCPGMIWTYIREIEGLSIMFVMEACWG